MEDILRDLDIEGYRLTMYATRRSDHRGCTTIGYRFHAKDGPVLFEGEDFNGSPMHADDSNETVRALLGFLTLRPGDTDREYFENYTAEQMAFAQGEAEYLGVYAMDESSDCGVCEGTGLVDIDDCQVCAGTGSTFKIWALKGESGR